MLVNKEKPVAPKIATMPAMPNGNKIHAPPRSTADHPAVAEHIARFNDMARELDHLRVQERELLNDLDLERRSNHNLQEMLAREVERADYFQRYAVEASTSLAHIENSASTAHRRAREVADRKQERIEATTPSTSDIAEQVENDIAQIAAKFAPKQEPE